MSTSYSIQKKKKTGRGDADKWRSFFFFCHSTLWSLVYSVPGSRVRTRFACKSYLAPFLFPFEIVSVYRHLRDIPVRTPGVFEIIRTRRPLSLVRFSACPDTHRSGALRYSCASGFVVFVLLSRSIKIEKKKKPILFASFVYFSSFFFFAYKTYA